MKLPATGGCRCGALRFEVTAAPLLTAACHCRGCQRMTGGPFSLSALIPTQAFRLTKGASVSGGIDHGYGHRFCGDCLSWVYTCPPGIEDFVNLRSTMLDDVPADPPFVETCTTEALPWVRTGAPHSFPAFPDTADWAPLVDSFAAARD